MQVIFRPLAWVGPTTHPDYRRTRWAFKASWHSTLDLLDRELTFLGAGHIVIEADFREHDLRLDGMPRGNARPPEFPGVRLSFESNHGPLMYATDSCEFWQHNVRSIALSLQALRSVDRYGVTRSGEQYTGWRAIEATAGVATVGQAQGLLSSYGGLRDALFATHPDHGGTSEDFQAVQKARDFLRAAGAEVPR